MAEQLGCTVSELLERISSNELSEWMAYYKIQQEEQDKELKEAERKTPKGKGRR